MLYRRSWKGKFLGFVNRGILRPLGKTTSFILPIESPNVTSKKWIMMHVKSQFPFSIRFKYYQSNFGEF